MPTLCWPASVSVLISLFSASDNELIGLRLATGGRPTYSVDEPITLLCFAAQSNKIIFLDLWKRVEASNAGEPGIYLSNDKDWGTNPCCEIGLRPFQFCNLTEVNVSNIKDQQDLEDRVRAASFIGTLQAGYTDFHYLRPVWQRTTEKDALIGVSMTGIASGRVLAEDIDLTAAASVVKEENARVAQLIGINKAARTTCVKPAGTTSWHLERLVVFTLGTTTTTSAAFVSAKTSQSTGTSQFITLNWWRTSTSAHTIQPSSRCPNEHPKVLSCVTKVRSNFAASKENYKRMGQPWQTLWTERTQCLSNYLATWEWVDRCWRVDVGQP